VVGVVACGFWMLESGVEGEGGMDVPPASSSSSSCGDALWVVSSELVMNASSPASAVCGDFAVGVLTWPWPFTVGLELGCSSPLADEPSTRPSPVIRLPSGSQCGNRRGIDERIGQRCGLVVGLVASHVHHSGFC